MTKVEITAWEKAYAKDLIVIGSFLDYLKQKKRGANTFRLFFKDGTRIIALFFGSSDSDNGLDLDDPDYEEFYELNFIVKKIEQQGANLFFNVNELIGLNYRNFFEKFELYEDEI